VGPVDDILVGEPIKQTVVVSQDVGWGRFNMQQLVWVVKHSRKNLVTYSAICLHQGCTINLRESA
jgi:Rieske Fe-S protein